MDPRFRSVQLLELVAVGIAIASHAYIVERQLPDDDIVVQPAVKMRECELCKAANRVVGGVGCCRAADCCFVGAELLPSRYLYLAQGLGRLCRFGEWSNWNCGLSKRRVAETY